MNNYIAPNYKTSAVITIDTQCDTLEGQTLAIPGASEAVSNMRQVLDAYRQHNMPIVHIVRIYRADGSNVELSRKRSIESGEKLFLEGSAGCELAPGLFEPNIITLNTELLLSGKVQTINDHEVIIYKPRWGAFYNTPLQSHLENLAVDTLIFTGSNFPNCPRASIVEASERDFKIVMVADAVSGVNPEGIEEMRNLGVVIKNTSDVVDEVNG